MVKEEYKIATTKTGIGSTYEPDLVNKLNKYCSLSGINRITFVSDLIEKELSAKVLEKEFIELEEPYYFLTDEGLNILDGKIEAVNDFNKLNLYDEYDLDLSIYAYIVKKIPNNLDSWSKEYNTYCFNNNPDLHKGVYIYVDVSIKHEAVNRIPIIFTYNASTNELELETVPSWTSLKNKLNLPVNAHDFLVDLEHNSKAIEHDVFSYAEEGTMLVDVDFELYYKTFEVIIPYTAEKELQDYLYLNYEYEGTDLIGFCLENLIDYEIR